MPKPKFNPGDRVRVTARFLNHSAVADMLIGKTGIVEGPDDHSESPWDYVAVFEGTLRRGGRFAFNEHDLELAN